MVWDIIYVADHLIIVITEQKVEQKIFFYKKIKHNFKILSLYKFKI